MLSLLALSSCSSELDENAKNINFTYITTIAGFGQNEHSRIYSSLLNEELTPFERGDVNLVLGRISKNNNNLINSMDFYHKAAETDDMYMKAISYETIASIKKSRYYYLRAAYYWKLLKDDKRYRIGLSLARGREPELEFDLAEIETPKKDLSYAKYVTIGNSYVTIGKDDAIVSQSDRVTRDWLSGRIQEPGSDNLLTAFSERLYYPPEELRQDIGWHEGGRLKELSKVNFRHVKAYGTLVARNGTKWYAENENGIFMFEVPEDKIFYPTTRFLTPNLAMVIDTHGMNMIVKQAIRNKATIAYADCDYPGKAKAALYLYNKGIKVICSVDRFAYLLLGYDTGITSSAPQSIENGVATIGKRPLRVRLNEKITVENVTNNAYSIQYYDAPTRYFRQMESVYNVKLNADYVTLENFGETKKVVDAAKKSKSKIIAARVFSMDDYLELKEWLLEDNGNKLILFHSYAYPYGYLIYKEFPAQATFGDVTPVFE